MFTKSMAVAVLAVAPMDKARTLIVVAQLRRKVEYTISVYQNVRRPNWRKSRVDLFLSGVLQGRDLLFMILRRLTDRYAAPSIV